MEIWSDCAYGGSLELGAITILARMRAKTSRVLQRVGLGVVTSGIDVYGAWSCKRVGSSLRNTSASVATFVSGSEPEIEWVTH